MTNELTKDEFLDFDVISPFHGSAGGVGFGRAVTLQELNEGTVIDSPKVDQPSDSDDSLWWTQEELIDHLKDRLDATGLMDTTPWGEKIKAMDPLIEDQVYKKTITPGVGGIIRRSNAILFHCNGYIEGVDEPFDSSILRGRPILHRLDREDLLPGLMVGVLSMRLHEKAEILIKPDYAFGELGCPPRIPANSTIIYIIEILRIFEEGSLADYEIMTREELAAVPFEEILAKCNEQRQSGNSYFKAERYKDAALRYNKAIKFLETFFYKDSTQQIAGREILSKLYPNIANALIRFKKVRAAMPYCFKALDIDPYNIKALVQLGKAKLFNAEPEKARHYFLRALDLRPADTYIGYFLTRVDLQLQEGERKSTELFLKMGRAVCGPTTQTDTNNNNNNNQQ